MLGRVLTLSNQRLLPVLGLGAVVAVAWVYLVYIAAGIEGMSLAAAKPWTPAEAAMMLVMWAVMMAGMMLPGAAPMILLFATIERRQRAAGEPASSTAIFGLGYVIAWTGFSLGATALQWALHEAALLTPMMASSSKTFAGLLFVAAGLYQWSALKHACLRHCRSPLHFIVQHWRQGRLGALRMGLIHGLYCIGCCWVLMGLLFAGGVMNLVWIAAIALFVLAEKVWGEAVARASGVAMLGVGAYLLVV